MEGDVGGAADRASRGDREKGVGEPPEKKARFVWHVNRMQHGPEGSEGEAAPALGAESTFRTNMGLELFAEKKPDPRRAVGHVTISRVPSITALAGKKCVLCIDRVQTNLQEAERAAQFAVPEDDCYNCRETGHWQANCLGTSEKPTTYSSFRHLRAYFTDELVASPSEGGVPPLVELAGKAATQLSPDKFIETVRRLIESHGQFLPSEAFALHVISCAPPALIDRLYYAKLPGLHISSEHHAIAMRRGQACTRHAMFVRMRSEKLFENADSMDGEWEALLARARDETGERMTKDLELEMWDLVTDHETLFTAANQRRDEYEEQMCFPMFRLAMPPLQRRAVARVPHKHFEKIEGNLHRIAGGLLDGIDLPKMNACIAGGAVLGALLLDPEIQVKKTPFFSTDIDIFMMRPAQGPSTGTLIERAELLVTDVVRNYNRICRNTTNDSQPRHLVVTTPCAMTIYFQGDFPPIQIIDGNFLHSVPELLATFDVDACAVAFDGRRFLADPRAARALTKGYNMLDPSLASPRYDQRLGKYGRRGFETLIPSMTASEVLEAAESSRDADEESSSSDDQDDYDVRILGRLLKNDQKFAAQIMNNYSNRSYDSDHVPPPYRALKDIAAIKTHFETQGEIELSRETISGRRMKTTYVYDNFHLALGAQDDMNLRNESPAFPFCTISRHLDLGEPFPSEHPLLVSHMFPCSLTNKILNVGKYEEVSPAAYLRPSTDESGGGPHI